MIMFKIFFFLLYCFIFSPGEASFSKVRLTEVQVLTLHRGEYTAGRRSAPVPQLRCVGGSAQGYFTPETVQCYNRGHDGVDVQWECKAKMPSEYEFGKLRVTCEGFEYPKDPYVLGGSCGLEYELNMSPLGTATYGRKTVPEDENSWILTFIYLLVVLFIIYIIVITLTNPRPGYEGDRDRGNGDYWGGGGGGGGGGFDDRRPPPPGFRGYPPSYDEATKGPRPSAPPTDHGTGPGFWSGLGVGALGGYFFGNRNAGTGYNGGAYQRRRYAPPNGYDGPSSSSAFYGGNGGGSGSSSSSTHESGGFGGTSRR